MSNADIFARYEEIDTQMQEVDRVDSIIDAAVAEPFVLPDDFDPVLPSEEEEKISKTCQALEDEMNGRGFAIQLDKGIPLKVRYLYVQHVALVTQGLEMPGKWLNVFNGCGGWCEGCFQGAWCSLSDVIENEDVAGTEDSLK